MLQDVLMNTLISDAANRENSKQDKLKGIDSIALNSDGDLEVKVGNRTFITRMTEVTSEG